MFLLSVPFYQQNICEIFVKYLWNTRVYCESNNNNLLPVRLCWMIRRLRTLSTASGAARRCIWNSPAVHDSTAGAAWMRRYVASAENDRDELIEVELRKQNFFSPEQLTPFEHLLNVTSGAVPFALVMRRDVLRLSRQRSKDSSEYVDGLRGVDNMLRKWLSVFFADDALTLDTVTFSKSAGTMLEFIAQNEGVHSLKTLPELKSRLSNGKRCFALFHSK